MPYLMVRMVGPGCGATYTHLSSHYVGMDAACQRLRPDLPWVDPISAIGGVA